MNADKQEPDSLANETSTGSIHMGSAVSSQSDR